MRRPLVAVLLAVVTLFAAGCGATASPSPSRAPAGPAEFQAALCASTDVFLESIGNPDSGVMSQAWDGLEQALERGDVAGVDATTRQMLPALAAARAAMARGEGWAPGAPAIAAWYELLGALEAYFEAVRAAQGDEAAVARADAQMQTAFGAAWTGWLQAMRTAGETGQLTESIPCSPEAPR